MSHVMHHTLYFLCNVRFRPSDMLQEVFITRNSIRLFEMDNSIKSNTLVSLPNSSNRVVCNFFLLTLLTVINIPNKRSTHMRIFRNACSICCPERFFSVNMKHVNNIVFGLSYMQKPFIMI